MEIGKKIRELRIARNLTQEALAAELSVTPQAISKWEIMYNKLRKLKRAKRRHSLQALVE